MITGEKWKKKLELKKNKKLKYKNDCRSQILLSTSLHPFSVSLYLITCFIAIWSTRRPYEHCYHTSFEGNYCSSSCKISNHRIISSSIWDLIMLITWFCCCIHGLPISFCHCIYSSAFTSSWSSCCCIYFLIFILDFSHHNLILYIDTVSNIFIYTVMDASVNILGWTSAVVSIYTFCHCIIQG